jgi:hypothetical protein
LERRGNSYALSAMEGLLRKWRVKITQSTSIWPDKVVEEEQEEGLRHGMLEEEEEEEGIPLY